MRFNYGTGQFEEDEEDLNPPKKKEDNNLKLKLISEFKPFINYSSQRIISYSQYSIYAACPHKWNLMYKLGLEKQPPNIHLIFGTSIHQTIQEFVRIFFEQTLKKAQEFDAEEYFHNALSEEYKKSFKQNGNVHFSSPEELREYYDDGVLIIKEFKKKIKRFFGKKGYKLVGIETPLFYNPLPEYKNVYFKASLDLILYHEPTEEYLIYDFKTSTRGWTKNEKSDESKQFQLILYKQFFSKQFNVELDKINVEFIILKRKLYDEAEFTQSRLQSFIPASGKVKLNKSKNQLEKFIQDAFNTDGSFRNIEFEKKPSKFNCKFCPFNQSQHCDKGVK